MKQLCEELKIIKPIVKGTKSKETITKILNLLKECENETSSVKNSTNTKESLRQSMTVLSIDKSNQDCDQYDLAWSQPSSSDYNALKLIADCLETEENIEELRDCLNHVKGKTDDFPVEFFMTPPYLIDCVLRLLSKRPYLIEECIDVCSLFLESLKTRVSILKLPTCQSSSENESKTKNQLKVFVVLNKTLFAVLEILDEHLIDDNFSIVNLIKLLVKLITSFPSSSQIDYKWLFLKMIVALRSYRKRIYCSGNATNIRLSYFLVLGVIHCVLPFVEEIKDSESNELKTALFDYSLHHEFPEIIQQLKSVVSLDTDLQDLLNIQDCFILIVEILQTKEIMPEDELILIGNAALQTVSIVESLSLTQLLFKAIRGKNTFLSRNLDLKSAALQILHRLLSCGSTKIRIYSYNQVNTCVKESFALLMERDSIQISLIKHGIFGKYNMVRSIFKEFKLNI